MGLQLPLWRPLLAVGQMNDDGTADETCDCNVDRCVTVLQIRAGTIHLLVNANLCSRSVEAAK